MDPSSDIIAADPRTRRNALLILGVSTVAGVVTIGWLWPALRDQLLVARATGRIPGRAICLTFLGLVAVLGAAVIISGVNMIRIGGRVVSNAQYPPRGMKVMHDTRIVRGPRAVFMGRVQRVLGILLILCALGLLTISGYAAIRLLWHAPS